MEKRYYEKKSDRIIRDRGDLRRNLINSVFEGLKVEDCLADRGDAKPSPIRYNKNDKTSLKLRPNAERKRTSETKNPKRVSKEDRSEFERFETNFKVNNDKSPEVARRKNTKKEVKNDPNFEECPITVTKCNLERRREDKLKEPYYSTKKDGKPLGKEGLNRTYLDLAGRKLLRERYTVKLKNSNKNCDEPDFVKDCMKLFSDDQDSKKQTDEENDKAKSSDHSESKKKKESLLVQRKPIIKTIKINNDSRVYKAVTFVDRKPTTPIQIKIPSDFKKAVKPELKNKMTAVSKVSIQIKQKKKGKRLNQRIPSPDIGKRCSPTTEVAKWAPSCLNQHTKPYYEAWVDTTLAAITKCSKKDKLYLEQQNIIKTFKRALEDRPNTPDMVYENCNDERYTGKITVRQR